MSISCANDTVAEPRVIAAKNVRSDAAAMEYGDVVQFTTAKNGISVMQPITLGLFSDCAGVLNSALAYGDQRNNLIIEGTAAVKFKNHASAAIGTHCKPVTAQDYFTYSAEPTRYILLTTQTSGTSVHKPAEEASPPKVLILPPGKKSVKTLTVDITDVGTAASVWAVFPEAATIIGADVVLNAAITSANSGITFKLGGTVITDMAITVTYSGSAAGSVYSAVAPSALNFAAAHTAIEVVNDGASTGTARGTVSIYYIAN